MPDEPTFRYLNLENRWPGFDRQGLEIRDAALSLARLPNLATPLTEPLPPVPGLDGPVGIAMDRCGNVYAADPAEHRILRVSACDDRMEPLPCLRGPGSMPGELLRPRGLAVGPGDALYIADSGNSRVQVIDLPTGQVRGVWGQPLPWSQPEPSHAPGRFLQPWDIAVDTCGWVYVADPGFKELDGHWRGGRLQKFGFDGTLDSEFSDRIARSGHWPGAPAGVGIAVLPGEAEDERILVLDREPPQLLVFQLNGDYDAVATERWARVVGADSRMVSVRVADGLLYAADAANGRILVFDTSGSLLDARPTADGSIAGLAVDRSGRLLTHPGGGGAVRRALNQPVYAECGTFTAGPFEFGGATTRWRRLQARLDPLSPGTHFRLFVCTSEVADGIVNPPPAVPVSCNGALPANVVPAQDVAEAELDQWRAAPRDATDLLVLNKPGKYLWIAGVMIGDGNATPTLRQMRLEYEVDGWLRHLPAVYQRDQASRRFLERALALYETDLEQEQTLLDDLPILFDPSASPDVAPEQGWLDWLAAWVDVELGEQWPPEVRRRAVATAFKDHAWRGTIGSLRRLVELYAGARPRIEEVPVTTWWLGVESSLGFDTALAPPDAVEAVLGASAVLARSRFSTPADSSTLLLDGDAHRFCVQVYAAQVPTDEAVAQLHRVLDREKPAHTTYHLCLVGPRMRVGFQARLGIDAIVAGAGTPGIMDDDRRLGVDTLLADGHAERARTDLLGGARVGSHAIVA